MSTESSVQPRWKQRQEQQTSVASKRIFGAILFVLFLVLVVLFIWLSWQPKAQQLFVESIVVTGYAPGFNTDDVGLLPDFVGAEKAVIPFSDAIKDVYRGSQSFQCFELSRREMSGQLKQASVPGNSERSDQDTTLLMFSGHAMVVKGQGEGEEGENAWRVYLLTTEGEDSPAGLPLKEFLKSFCEKRNGNKVVLLDVFQLAPDIWLGHTKQHWDLFAGVDTAVKELDRDDLVVITACGPEQRSYYSDLLGQRPVFAWAVTSFFETEQEEGEEFVTLGAAINQIRAKVEGFSGGLQSPKILFAGDEGDRDKFLSSIRLRRKPKPKNDSESDSNEGKPEKRASGNDRDEKEEPSQSESSEEPETPWYERHFLEQPWTKQAAYSPLQFRSALHQSNEKDRQKLLDLASEDVDELNKKLPVWENQHEEAKARRNAKIQLLAACELADRCSRLAEITQPYSARLNSLGDEQKTSLIDETKQLVDVLREQINELDPIVPGGQRGVGTLEDACLEIQKHLDAVLTSAIKDVTQAVEIDRWDLEAELTARSIINSGIIPAEFTNERDGELQGLTQRPELVSRLKPFVRDTNRNDPEPFESEAARQIRREVLSLVDLTPNSSLPVKIAPFLRQKHKLKARIQLQFACRPSLISTENLLDGVFEDKDDDEDIDVTCSLPSDTVLDDSIGPFAKFLIDGKNANSYELMLAENPPSESLKVKVNFGGDMFSERENIAVEIEFDEEDDKKVLSVTQLGRSLDDNIVVNNYSAFLNFRIQASNYQALRVEPKTFTINLLDATNRKLIDGGLLRIKVFGDDTPQLQLTMHRQVYRQDEPSWKRLDQGGSLQCYADLSNTFRLKAKNLSNRARSYGLALYALKHGNEPIKDELSSAKPLGVAYLGGLSGESQPIVFGDPPALPEPDASDDAGGDSSVPTDQILIGELNRLYNNSSREESEDPMESIKALAVTIVDDKGNSLRTQWFPLQVSSPIKLLALPSEVESESGKYRLGIKVNPQSEWPCHSREWEALQFELRPMNTPGILEGLSGRVTFEFPSDKETPFILDCGTYRGMAIYDYVRGDDVFALSNKPYLKCLGVFEEGAFNKPLDQQPWIVQKIEPALYAIFECYLWQGESISAAADTTWLGGTDPEVKRSIPANGRVFSAECELMGSAIKITPKCKPLIIPIAPASKNHRTYKQTIRVKVAGKDPKKLPSPVSSPTVIVDDSVPRIKTAKLVQRGIIEGKAAFVNCDIGFEEKFSGVGEVLAKWDGKDDEEKILLSSDFGEDTVRIPISVEGLKAREAPYPLNLRLVDRAGNKGPDSNRELKINKLTLKVSAPKKLTSNGSPSTMSTEDKPKKTFDLKVRVSWPSGGKIDKDDAGRLVVKASGPKSVTLSGPVNSVWTAKDVPDGEYEVKVSGSLLGNVHNGELGSVSPIERGSSTTEQEITLEKGR